MTALTHADKKAILDKTQRAYTKIIAVLEALDAMTHEDKARILGTLYAVERAQAQTAIGDLGKRAAVLLGADALREILGRVMAKQSADLHDMCVDMAGFMLMGNTPANLWDVLQKGLAKDAPPPTPPTPEEPK